MSGSLVKTLATILTSKASKEAVEQAPALIPRQSAAATPEMPQEAMPEIPIDAPMPANPETPPITTGESPVAIAPEASPNAAPVEEVHADMLDEAVSRADEAKDFMSTSIDEYDTSQSWQPNFDHIDSDEQAQSLVAGLSDRFVDEIDEARRGVIRDQELHDMARELGQKPEFLEKILSRETGQPANAETIMASRHVLHESGRSLKEMAIKVLAGEADDNMKLKFHRQWDFHNQFMAQYMGARAEVGRAMRSYGIPMGSDSMKNKRMAEITETQGGRFDLLEVAEQIANADTFEGLNGIVKGQKGGMSKGGAAMVEWFVASVLSGVKTHIVNTSGNALMTAVGPIETAMAARMGRGISGPDKIIKGEALAQTFGLINGFRDALTVMWKVAKTGEPYGGVAKFESAYPKAISGAELGVSGPWSWMIDIVGATARIPLERVMGPVDGFFRSINERAKVSQLAYREAARLRSLNNLSDEEYIQTLNSLLTDVPDHIKEAGVDYSLYNMAATPLGEFGQGVQKTLNKSAPAKIIVPFVRTPTNIMKMGFVERTPLGLLSKNLREDLASGSERAQMARARLAFGSMLGATMAVYSVNEMITGSGPSNYDDMRLKRATGWQPRSFVFTDEQGNKEYISYDRSEPLSYIIGSVADLVEMNKMSQYDSYSESDYTEAINAISLVIAENSLNKTFMTGIRDFMLALTPGTAQKSKMRNWQAGLANAMLGLSGARRDARKLQDPYMRQTITIIDKLKNSTPFMSDSLPKSLDIMGEPIMYKHVLNPWPSSEETPDLVIRHVGSLLDSTGETAIRMPKRSIKGISLSAQEYHDVINLSRKVIKAPIGNGEEVSFRQALIKLIKSDDYQGAPTDFLRVEAIRDIQSAFDGAARLYMLNPENTEWAGLQTKVREREIGEASQTYGAENVQRMLNQNAPSF